MKPILPLVTVSGWLLFAVVVLAIAVALVATYDRGRRL